MPATELLPLGAEGLERLIARLRQLMGELSESAESVGTLLNDAFYGTPDLISRGGVSGWTLLDKPEDLDAPENGADAKSEQGNGGLVRLLEVLHRPVVEIVEENFYSTLAEYPPALAESPERT